MRYLLFNSVKVLILLLCSHHVLAIDDQEKEAREKLMTLLTNKPFNEGLIEDLARSVTYKGRSFRVDDAGQFYLRAKDGKKHLLNIYYDDNSPPGKKIFIIEDPQHPAAGLPRDPYDTHLATVKQTIAFDDLVSAQRLKGIHAIKSINPYCYVVYAAQRLGSNNLYRRLLALERGKNPRPLAFKTDKEWQEFVKELQDVFKPFAGPDAHIAIIGTSTTFFSENPRKGKNKALFEKYPDCVMTAQDETQSADVYTFDTPGQDRSDLDVHILIPRLSNLCHLAEENSYNSLGNTGQKVVYYENTIHECFLKSQNPKIREQVKDVNLAYADLMKTTEPDKPLGKFVRKWTKKLNRPINFSILIRPDHRKGSLSEPGVKDFKASDYFKRPVIFPVR